MTLLTVPPLRVQSRLPSALNARDIGNSPSDETGLPIWLMFVGVEGSIENREIVFDPAYTSVSVGSPYC